MTNAAAETYTAYQVSLWGKHNDNIYSTYYFTTEKLADEAITMYQQICDDRYVKTEATHQASELHQRNTLPPQSAHLKGKTHRK